MCVCVCSLLCVCVPGWVKYRKHISLLVILCIIVYVTNKKQIYIVFFSKPISEYGKIKSSLALLSILPHVQYIHTEN